jgi:hypothetical protein
MPSVVKQVYYRKHPEKWKMERLGKKVRTKFENEQNVRMLSNPLIDENLKDRRVFPRN